MKQTRHPVLLYPTDEGFTDSQWEEIRAVTQPRMIAPLFFPPKSGGTMLGRALMIAAQHSLMRVMFRGGDEDHVLYYPYLLDQSMQDSPRIAHAHTVASPNTVDLVCGFALRPVLMRRSIADCLLSFYKHRRADGEMGEWGTSCSSPDFFERFSEAEHKDFLIDMVAPWYLRYYATWQREAEKCNAIWLEFSGYAEDPVSTILKALDHFRITAPDDPEQCWAEVWEHREDLRYRKGVSGDGEPFFGKTRMQRLRRMARFTGADYEGLL